MYERTAILEIEAILLHGYDAQRFVLRSPLHSMFNAVAAGSHAQHHQTSARFWNKVAQKYAASAIADLNGYERTLERTRELLHPLHQVMEIGCGTATTALRLAPFTARYVASDISAAMIEIAQEKLKLAPPHTRSILELVVAHADSAVASPVQGSPTEPLHAQCWDVVLAFNVLHLVPDLDHSLSQASQRLKPGGRFISKTPCLAQMSPWVSKLALPLMRGLGFAPDVKVLSEQDLVRAMERQGFMVESVEHHASRKRWQNTRWRPFIVARKA